MAAYELNPTSYLNAWKNRNDPTFPEPLRMLLENAEKGTRELSEKELTIRLTNIRVLKNMESFFFWDKAATVYAVSLVLDTSGKSGNDLSTGDPVFTGMEPGKSKYITIQRTPLFNNIMDGDKLPVLGGGIVLYGPRAPKCNIVEMHGVIAEGDKGYQKLGKILEEASEKTQISNAVEALMGLTDLAVPQVKAMAAAFWATFQLVVTGLKNNEDDVIGDFHASFLRHLGWNLGSQQISQRGFTGDLIAEMN